MFKPAVRQGSLPLLLIALVVYLGFFAAAHSPPAGTLSPAVREFVNFDDPVIALTHVRVIDGTGAAPRVDQTLILRDGKIAAIRDAASTPNPSGAKVLDLPDHTVFPGIIGMHDHMFYPQPVNMEGRRVRGVLQSEQQSSFTLPRLYLAGGVISLRTTASVEPYAPVLGSHCQRSHGDPAAGSAGVGQREMPRGVAVQPTPRSGGRSH